MKSSNEKQITTQKKRSRACHLGIFDILKILGGYKRCQMPFGVVEEIQNHVPNCCLFYLTNIEDYWSSNWN